MRALALVFLAGCASAAYPTDPCAAGEAHLSCTPAGRGRAEERLARLRELSVKPRTERVSLALREPRSGRVLEARGAVAISPPSSLRMILLGPGGTTAIDLWIAADRYRFEVPAISLSKRGDHSTPASERRGLPVDFLRYWLLAPAGGSLIWYDRAPAADRFALRDGDAIVELTAHDDGRVQARRSTWSADRKTRLDEETVDASRIVCGETRYQQASTGLTVTVRCEGEEPAPPPARAFADPDAVSP